ncbi:MAG: serine hydrolase [Bacteroidales bacterium]|nr:serine hydrolase [Bacteroidales bacterium]
MRFGRISKYFAALLLIIPAFFIQSTTIEKKHNKEAKRSNINYTDTDSWVDSLMNTMTDDEKLGQLFMAAAYPNQGKANIDHLTSVINKYNIGGLIFFKGGPVSQAKLTNYYQSISKIPVMIAGDYEWGLSMRLDSTVKYPRQMMLGAIQNDILIYEFGVEIARQCKRLGININFAPVIDVNNNANNPVINSRSFGEIKENVAKKGLAYMVGLQDNGILATGKHFPGHGDTDVDSHKDLPIIKHSINRLDSIELYPFKELINSGLGAIMMAHLHIPSLDSEENRPSSLSEPIVTELLKNKINFDGLIFTDALGMQGVSKYYEPGETEVAALIAGVDVLLMPENIPIAFEKIKKAIKKGKLSQKDIDERCRKILTVKNRFGLNNYKPVEIKNIYNDLNTEDAKLLNRKLIESSLTLALNKDNIIPFKNLDKDKIASISVGNGYISNFQKRLAMYDDVSNFAVNKGSEMSVFNKQLNKLSKYDKVVVSIHKMSNNPPYFGVNGNTVEFVRKLSLKTKVILVLFGNPYALKRFKEPENLKAVLVSYNDWQLTRDLSAQLLFGGITSQGQLPVSAGDLFPAGKGDLVIKKRLGYSDAFSLGLNTDTLLKIDSVIKDAIIQNATPGATVMAVRNGTVFYYKSWGYHTYAKKHKTNNFDIYDLASITKIASTLPSLMKLYEEKKIDINKKLSEYMPVLIGTNKENIIIKDILAHQAKLKPWIPFYITTYKDQENNILNNTIYSKYKNDKFSVKVADNLYITKSYRDTIYQKIYNSELRTKKKYKYSDLGFILFHKMIEDLTKEQQEDYVRENFYNKLGANTLGYLPLEHYSKNDIVPTENDNFFRKQLIQGYVHDYAAAMTGNVNGHAGIFSNANDLAKLLQMYLGYGKYGGERYLNKRTIKLFSTCVFCKTGNRRGLGFDKPLRPTGGPSSQFASDESFGHSGFTGALVWIDPKYDFIYIFLSNRIHPTSENNKLLKMDVRTKVQDLFYKSFPDLDTLKTTANLQ